MQLGTRTAALRGRLVFGRLPLPDVVLAVALAAVAVLELLIAGRQPWQRPVDPVAVLLTLVVAGSLAGRRRWPVPAFTVGMGAAVAQTLAGYPGSVGYGGLMIGLYSVAAYTGRRRTVATTVSAAVVWSAMTAVDVLVLHRYGMGVVDAVVSVVYFVAPPVLGGVVRERRHYAAERIERAIRLERLRRLEAERALSEERARIARELHDIIAHHVSGMVLQAGAAQRQAQEAPGPVRDALGRIRESGAAALAAMRDVVGILRDPDTAVTGAGHRPPPGLGELDDLVASARAGGQRITLVVTGPPRALPAHLELCAYRVVQEALTNAARHAPTSHVSVGLQFGRTELDIRVLDHGPVPPDRDDPDRDGRDAAGRGGAVDRAGQSAADRVGHGPADGVVEASGGGHGLIGMRERVTASGGRLVVGRTGGGWLVHALLPIPVLDAADPVGGRR